MGQPGVVYGDSSSRICGGSGPEVTLVTCPEVCSAHAQPKVVQYPPQWGLLTGSDKVT